MWPAVSRRSGKLGRLRNPKGRSVQRGQNPDISAAMSSFEIDRAVVQIHASDGINELVRERNERQSVERKHVQFGSQHAEVACLFCDGRPARSSAAHGMLSVTAAVPRTIAAIKATAKVSYLGGIVA